MTPAVVSLWECPVTTLPSKPQSIRNGDPNMDQIWPQAALWLLLALVAVLLANWLRVSTALSEIVVGTAAQLIIGALAGGNALGAKTPRITFLAGTGAVVLTFLVGAELDPVVFRAKWKESSEGLSHARHDGSCRGARHARDGSAEPAVLGSPKGAERRPAERAGRGAAIRSRRGSFQTAQFKQNGISNCASAL